MTTPLPYRYFSFNVGGQNQLDYGAYTNTPDGYSEITYDEFLNQAKAKDVSTDTRFGGAKTLYDYYQRQGTLNKIAPGNASDYVQDENGVFMLKSAYEQKQAAKADPNLINVGTEQAPLYVPKGSAAEANLPNIGTQNTAIAANAGQPAVQTVPGTTPQNQPQNAPTATPGASTGQIDATVGQNPVQVGGKFGTQNFGRVGNDVYELMSDGSQRKVSEAEFNNNLRARGLNLDVLPQISPTSGFDTGLTTGFAGSGPDGIMGTADDAGEPKGPASFVSDYQGIIKDLGLTSIKTEFENIQKQYKELQEKKLDEQLAVNDNPWLSEGARTKKLASIDAKYEGKQSILTEQMKLYDSLYQEGLAEAKFLTSGLQEDRNKLLDIAQKREEAAAKLLELDPSTYKEVNGGLFDLNTQSWIVPPKATGTGVSDLTTAQMNATINSIANSFDNEQIVKNFNVINEGYQFVKSIPNTTTNPADDQALIYALAKALDPNSVVREGEYATAQKYSQSWIKAYGSGVKQAIAGTGFLSQEARTNIKKTIEQRYQASKTNYDNVYQQYQQRLDNVRAGGFNTLTNYGAAFQDSGADPLIELQDDIRTVGSTYKTREELIGALESAYPEMTTQDIATQVYTLIPDK